MMRGNLSKHHDLAPLFEQALSGLVWVKASKWRAGHEALGTGERLPPVQEYAQAVRRRVLASAEKVEPEGL